MHLAASRATRHHCPFTQEGWIITDQVRHPIFSRLYPWLSRKMEARGMGELRVRLLGGLTGDVIELGAGNGLNFPHYPPDVTRVLAVEPEPRLRQLAEEAAAEAPVPVEVVAGVADRLPAGDGEFDAAVVSLVLCSVPHLHRALDELRRVLRPGGQLRFLEHVLATTERLRRAQQALDATIWPMVGAGCHASRDTATAIAAAGFEISDIERFRFPEGPVPLPTSPHVLGAATAT